MREEGEIVSGQELRQEHTPDDFGHFFRSWIRNPLATGAFAPSGRSLSRLMATGLAAGARVLELGAGTGTVTEAILANGVRAKDLYLVERNPQFVRILERRFPHCQVLPADALALQPQLQAGSFDFVVSGLPLVLFSPEKRLCLLRQAFALLGPQGLMHQFTYAGRCPIDRDVRRVLQIDSVLLGIAALNLPPAFVYRLSRAS